MFNIKWIALSNKQMPYTKMIKGGGWGSLWNSDSSSSRSTKVNSTGLDLGPNFQLGGYNDLCGCRPHTDAVSMLFATGHCSRAAWCTTLGVRAQWWRQQGYCRLAQLTDSNLHFFLCNLVPVDSESNWLLPLFIAAFCNLKVMSFLSAHLSKFKIHFLQFFFLSYDFWTPLSFIMTSSVFIQLIFKPSALAKLPVVGCASESSSEATIGNMLPSWRAVIQLGSEQ